MTRSTVHPVLAIAGTTVLALALASCGGGPKTLTASQFRTQAQAICAAAQKDVKSYGDGFSATPTDAQITVAVGKLYDRVNKEADQIAALNEPANLTKDVTAMLVDVRAGAKKIKDLGAGILTATQNPFVDANTKAKALGLTGCVS